MKANTKIQFFFIIALVSVGFFSCDPNEELPPETVLKYVGYQPVGNDSVITGLSLQIHVEKGNGNIGMETWEKETPPFVGEYADNLYVNVFDKQEDGTYDTLKRRVNNIMENVYYPYCIPPLGTDPKSSVRATLNIGIYTPNFDFLQADSKLDSVYFEIYMYDRDLNQSNIIRTDTIQIK
ncbi:MAG: hypothetical protein LBU91_02885 [Bacteroidales bacterium]|jgi:hypothetical protein|nr:hypothetical protein [Bacteroidales bacterium]